MRVVVLLATLALSQVAAAQATWTPSAGTMHVGVDATWTEYADGDVVAMGAGGQVPALRTLFVDFDLPWVAGRLIGEPVAHGGVGNITLGVHRIWRPRWNVSISFGGTVSIPTEYRIAGTNDALASTSLLTLAASAFGGEDAYRYLPEFLGARLPFELEVWINPFWRYRLDVLVGSLIGVGADSLGNASPISVESSSTFAAHLPNGFLFDAGVHFTALEIVYTYALSAEASIGYQWPNGVYAVARGYFSAGSLSFPWFTGLDATSIVAGPRAVVGWRF